MTDDGFEIDRRDLLRLTGGSAPLVFTPGVVSRAEAQDSVAEGKTVYVGFTDGSDDKLYAIDAETGEEVWGFNAPNLPNSPTVVDGTVYIGFWSQGGDPDNLYALNAPDGSKKWGYTTIAYTTTSATVVDGTVYVGSNSTGSQVYAVNKSDGSEVWKFKTGDKIVSAPTVVGGTVYVGSDDSNLYAIDAETGNEEWNYTTGGEVESSPAVVGGTVYVGSRDDNLYAIDAETGSEVWRFETDEKVVSSPTVVRGNVYIGSGVSLSDGTLYAVEAKTGEQEWAFTEPSLAVGSSPTVVDGTVYVGSNDGNLYAVDTSSGNKKWSYSAGGVVDSSPTVVYNPSNGSSVGSRVLQGTDGHHNVFAEYGPTPEGTGTVTGEVTKPGGDPAPDANVTFVDTSTDETVKETTTDTNGAYDAQLPAGTTYNVVAQKENFGLVSKEVTVSENTTEVVNLTLESNPEGTGTVTGEVTDSSGNPLEDIEVRFQNQEAEETTVVTTDKNGEYETSIEAGTRYRVVIIDQFGLDTIEFEKYIELNEDETRQLNIELLTQFEVFKNQKLGNDNIEGLAPRIDEITTPLVNETSTVEAEINEMETAVEQGELSQELAADGLERMVWGEALVNRSLEALTDKPPINLTEYKWSNGTILYEDEMPDFPLLFQTAEGIVIGLVEATYSLKAILKSAFENLADSLISNVVDLIRDAVRSFMESELGMYDRSLETAEKALSIAQMLNKIDNAATEALKRLEGGLTFDNVRKIILDLAKPIAIGIEKSLLAAIETVSIGGQVNSLNTALSADSLKSNPSFTNDIDSVANDAAAELETTVSRVEQADDIMEPKSDALEELINLVAELSDLSWALDLPEVLDVLGSIFDLARELVSVIKEGFNIGYGIGTAAQITDGSSSIINKITDTS